MSWSKAVTPIRELREPVGILERGRRRYGATHDTAPDTAPLWILPSNSSRPTASRCRPHRWQSSGEVKRGGLSRPAPTEPAPRPARTSLRRCRRRSRSRPSHRWPRSRKLREPCRKQPGREAQRGGLSRPAQAEPVTPPARTSLRRCRRCGELACAAATGAASLARRSAFKCPQIRGRLPSSHAWRFL